VDNLRLVCRPHNQAAAEQVFGRDFIDRKKRERRANRLPSAATRAE
jgi:hypothetical protein